MPRPQELLNIIEKIDEYIDARIEHRIRCHANPNDRPRVEKSLRDLEEAREAFLEYLEQQEE